jgi:hypothetical protein
MAGTSMRPAELMAIRQSLFDDVHKKWLVSPAP